MMQLMKQRVENSAYAEHQLLERLFNRVVVKSEVKRLGSESSDGDFTLSHL